MLRFSRGGDDGAKAVGKRKEKRARREGKKHVAHTGQMEYRKSGKRKKKTHDECVDGPMDGLIGSVSPYLSRVHTHTHTHSDSRCVDVCVSLRHRLEATSNTKVERGRAHLSRKPQRHSREKASLAW